ncbi:hypothetical protein VDGL01_12000 [Verticillium dahliae]
MNQNQVENIERNLHRDRGMSWRGTARVRFAHLHFGNLCPRKPNEKIITHLKETFKIEGCLRLEPKNHIPAVISQKMLNTCVSVSTDMSQSMLLENPKKEPPLLKFPDGVTIECLQGLHRISAAKGLLPRRDWWWTVDLYLEDASEELKTALSEEYSNSANFSDGEIFLKLRQYGTMIDKQTGTIFAEKRMWGRLSKEKRKDLKQILKQEVIITALDALRVLPGLFAGFRIEHRFVAMKCPEEMSHYLHHILQIWTKIYGGKKSLMRQLDSKTVELVQLRAPGCSSHDASVVANSLHNSEIFLAVQNQDDRKTIGNNLLSIRCLVPSLYSFFEDVKYLQAPAKIMRQLCPQTKLSIREAMWHIFTGHNLAEHHWLLQTGESDEDYQSMRGSASDQFEFSYQQMWLYAWRHWTELVPECPKKEDGEATPTPQSPDPRRRYGMAKMAGKVGFESDQINQLLSWDPDREHARESLLKARNPEYFRYDESAFNSYVTDLCRIYKQATKIPLEGAKPCLLVAGSGEGLERRCGRVYAKAYKSDRKHLFLYNLYYSGSGGTGGVSSFAVRVSVFFAFFGRRSSTNRLSKPSAEAQPQPLLNNANSERPHTSNTTCIYHARKFVLKDSRNSR